LFNRFHLFTDRGLTVEGPGYEEKVFQNTSVVHFQQRKTNAQGGWVGYEEEKPDLFTVADGDSDALSLQCLFQIGAIVYGRARDNERAYTNIESLRVLS